MFRLRVATALLIAYWSALFISTHLPVHGPQGIKLPVDKFAHFAGYGLLAFLFAWAVVGSSRPKIVTLIGLWVAIITYGAFDELTQSFVHRTPDIRDWAADAIGAALGLGAFAVLNGLLFARNRSARLPK